MRIYPKGLFLAMALILLLSGSIAAAATPEPPANVADPAGAEVREPSAKTIQDALENTGAPKNPYAPGGYPNGVPAFAVPDASTYSTDQVEDWETGPICVGTDLCITGDFNGDGKDDIAVLKRDFGVGVEYGDVLVALAGGGRFGSLVKWSDNFCLNGAVCQSGDVNGDGKSDIVSFQRGNGGAGTGNVSVLISTGGTFLPSALWNSYFCVGSEQCAVGDFNGDNLDDILLFKKSLYGDAQAGDVLVSLSNGSSFAGVGKWQELFCIEAQQCGVGDFNGDGRDDIIIFAKNAPNMVGQVVVAPSLGGSFDPSPKVWNSYFCPGNEICDVGDFDGDGREDILAQAREGYPSNPSTFGDVNVGLSGGNSFLPGQKWNEQFCVPGQECLVGDFNGDKRDDLVALVRTNGQAFVALAAGSPVGFVAPPGNPPGLWQDYFCTNQEVCATGDFNGDGRDDILYFVRSSQGGVGEGDVFVALSTGSSFGVIQKWHDYFCLGQDNCQVGDFNGDGRDDLVSFSRVANGQVYVVLSTGNGFGASSMWNSFFCPNPEWCEVGDFNGDKRDDVVTFTRNSYGNTNVGRVIVALSSASSFVTVGQWNGFFCIQNEWCATGDMNGDGRDDIVTFTKGSSADVFVGLSTGAGFLNGTKWNDFFCAGAEVCRIADFNGDKKDDAVTFLRSDYQYANPPSVGDVVVALSTGSSLASQPKWNDFFCIGQEFCDVGDFNGDQWSDVTAFTKTTVGANPGDVYVALRSAGTGYAFIATPGTAEPKNQYIGSLIVRKKP